MNGSRVFFAIVLASLVTVFSCQSAKKTHVPAAQVFHPAESQEARFGNIQQLTFEGENAEAYFSADGQQLVFQARSTELEDTCDQIYTMTVGGDQRRLVSTGKGRTTCSYFLDGDERILYASTHLGGDGCPPVPKHEGRRYVWPIFDSYDIFSARPDGSDLRRLTDSTGYDAEATVSPDGSLVVFTSNRDGDLELYLMKPDGSDQTRVTDVPGYDGGAFFSPDGTQLCFRASRPKSNAALLHYRKLLSRQLVEPTRMEIFLINVDGSDMRQVTNNGRANFCPYFHPSGERLIFASNFHSSQQGRPNFDLFLIDIDGQNIRRVTFHDSFDGFPMFSPDGKKFVWCSNRFAKTEGDTNVFLADWVENTILENP